MDDSLFLKDDGGADGIIIGGTAQSRLTKLNTTQGNGLVTEEEYKTLKLESNLQNLNKDLETVNDEIEEIKRLLFQQNEATKNVGPKMVTQEVPKRQLEPVAKRFQNDEELLDYYEMKAVDAFNNCDDEDSLKDMPLRSRPSTDLKCPVQPK